MNSLGEKLYVGLPGLRNTAATIKGLLVNRQRYGRHYRRSIGEIVARADWNPATMFDYQSARLREVIGIAARHVPYYREWFRNNGISPDAVRCPDDLQHLPILEKDLVRADPL